MSPRYPLLADLKPSTEANLVSSTPTYTARGCAKLGWILIKNRLVSPSQLAAALSSQFLCHKKLGELLMEEHLLSEDQLKDALREQLLRRRGHWVI